MALNLFNPQERELFKRQQIAQGRSPSEVDAIIARIEESQRQKQQQEEAQRISEEQKARDLKRPVSTSVREGLGGGTAGKIIGEGIVRPAEDVARFGIGSALSLGAGVNALGRGIGEKLTGKDLKFEESAENLGNVVQSMFRPEEIQALTSRDVRDPLKLGAKRGLQASSFILPTKAATIKGAGTRGALASSMAEAGEDETTLGNVALAGATGFGTGALIKGLPSVVKRAKGSADDLTRGIRGRTAKQVGKVGEEFTSAPRGFEQTISGDPFFTSNLDEMNRVADDLRLRGSSKAQLSQSNQAFNELSEQIDDVLSKTDASTTFDDVMINLVDDLDNNIAGFDPNDKAVSKTLDQIGNKMQSFSDDANTISAQGLFKLKQDVGSSFKRAFQKSNRGLELKPQDEVVLQVYNSLRRLVDEVSGNPQISQMTKTQSTLFDITNALQKQITKTPVGLGALTPKIPAVNRGLQSASSQAGRFLKFASDVAQPSGTTRTIRPNAGARLANQLDKSSSKAMRELARKGVILGSDEALEGLMFDDGTPVDSQVNASELSAQQSSRVQSVPTEPSVQLGNFNLTRNDVFQLMLLDQTPQNQAFYRLLLEEIGRQEKSQAPVKTTATQERDSDLARSGLRAVDDIRGILEDDKFILAKDALIPSDLFTRRYNASVTRAVESLLRARSGAAVPDKEVERYTKQFLPQMGDSAETVEFKLTQLEQDLLDILQPSSAGAGALNEFGLQSSDFGLQFNQ